MLPDLNHKGSRAVVVFIIFFQVMSFKNFSFQEVSMYSGQMIFEIRNKIHTVFVLVHTSLKCFASLPKECYFTKLDIFSSFSCSHFFILHPFYLPLTHFLLFFSMIDFLVFVEVLELICAHSLKSLNILLMEA